MDFILYAFAGLPYLVAFLLSLGICFLVIALVKSPSWGAGMILVAAALEALFVFIPPIRIGINIFLGDVVSITLGIALLMRVRKFPWNSMVANLWLGFGLFSFLSFALGLVAFRAAAGSDFRTVFFYPWVAICYFMSFSLTDSQMKRICGLFVCAASFMVALACLRWAAEVNRYDLGAIGVTFPDDNHFRVVSAEQAMVIGVAALMLLNRWLSRQAGVPTLAFCGVLLLTVLILQHRSVWVTEFLGILALLMLRRRQAGRGSGVLVFAFAFSAAVLALAVLAGSGNGLGRSLGQSVQEVGSERSTFVGRTEGWRNLLSEWSAGGARSYAVGQPYGSGYRREQQDATVQWTPHNYYVTTLLRTGVPGVVMMAFTFLIAGLRLFRARRIEEMQWAGLLFAFVVLELAFFIPYGALFSHAIYCGMALSVAARLQRVLSPSVDTGPVRRPLSGIAAMKTRPLAVRYARPWGRL